MENKLIFRLAEFLYKYAFPVYKVLYRQFKQKQDAEEIAVLRKWIKPGDVVLDVGSNIGFYTTMISDMVGENGVVHCFEPDKRNFHYLQKTVSGRKNVMLNNAAVSDASGKLTIYTSHRLNVDHRTYQPEEYADSYTVDALSIDDYLGDNKKVNFIKIDIQGAELSAFKGMTETLKENNLTILAELWPYGLKSAGGSTEDLLSFMKGTGYAAFMLQDGKTAPLTYENIKSIGTEEKDYCNILFKRSL